MQKKNDNNTIFIGQKPMMNYVLAIVRIVNNNNSGTIKARGRAISLAVDVAEMAKRTLGNSAKVSAVNIGTEQLPGKDKKLLNVSSIEIVFGNPGS